MRITGKAPEALTSLLHYVLNMYPLCLAHEFVFILSPASYELFVI